LKSLSFESFLPIIFHLFLSPIMYYTNPISGIEDIDEVDAVRPTKRRNQFLYLLQKGVSTTCALSGLAAMLRAQAGSGSSSSSSSSDNPPRGPPRGPPTDMNTQGVVMLDHNNDNNNRSSSTTRPISTTVSMMFTAKVLQQIAEGVGDCRFMESVKELDEVVLLKMIEVYDACIGVADLLYSNSSSQLVLLNNNAMIMGSGSSSIPMGQQQNNSSARNSLEELTTTVFNSVLSRFHNPERRCSPTVRQASLVVLFKLCSFAENVHCSNDGGLNVPLEWALKELQGYLIFCSYNFAYINFFFFLYEAAPLQRGQSVGVSLWYV